MDPLEVIALAHAASNAGDHEGHLNAYSEDATTTTPGNVTAGREAMGEFTKTWQHACPDAKVLVVNQIVSDGTVAEEFVFEGTHTDTLVLPGRKFPATDRFVRVFGALFVKVEHDKIVSERVYLDELSAFEQMR